MASVKGRYSPYIHYTTENTNKVPFVFPTPELPHTAEPTTSRVVTTLRNIFEEATVNSTLATSNTTNPITIDEVTNSNNTFIGLSENTTSSVITNVLNNGTNMLDGNSTVASNTSAAESTFSYVTRAVTDAINVTEYGTTMSNPHSMHETSDNTAYVVAGVIIGVLMVIGLVLLAMYVVYKKKNSDIINGQYNVNKHNSTDAAQLSSISNC